MRGVEEEEEMGALLIWSLVVLSLFVCLFAGDHQHCINRLVSVPPPL